MGIEVGFIPSTSGATNVDNVTLDVNGSGKLEIKPLGVANAQVGTSAGIVESKIAFDTSTGHAHTGSDSKLVSRDFVYIGNSVITSTAKATISYASIPTGYKTLHIEIFGVPPASTPDAGYVDFIFNDDSGAYYSTQQMAVENTGVSGTRQSGATYGEFGNLASTDDGCYIKFDIQQHTITDGVNYRIHFYGCAGLMTKFIELFGRYNPTASTDITKVTCNWRCSGAGLYWGVGTIMHVWGMK